MRYCDFLAGSFAGSDEEDVPPVVEPLPPAEAPEPLGEAAEPELAPPLAVPPAEPEPLELGADELLPPEAPPDFEASLAFEASLEPDPPDAEELDAEPDGVGVAVEPVGAGAEELAPPEGDVVDEEPAVEGGVVVLLLLLLPAVPPGVAGRPVSLPHAATPKIMPTASARVESFMCPPWLGCIEVSKRRARRNALSFQALCRARRVLCRGLGSSYFVPAPPVAPLEPPGPPGFFWAPLVLPEVPPAPDGLELPVAELPPLEVPPPC